MQLRVAAFSVSVVIAETIGGEIYLLTLSYVIAKYNNTTTISLPPCGSHLLSWSSCHVLLCATIFRPLYSSSTTTLEWYDQRPTIESHSILHLRVARVSVYCDDDDHHYILYISLYSRRRRRRMICDCKGWVRTPDKSTVPSAATTTAATLRVIRAQVFDLCEKVDRRAFYFYIKLGLRILRN